MALKCGGRSDAAANCADTALAADNVEAGRAELGKFYASVKANRGFILRLFAVLAFVIVLFGIFKR